MKNLMLRFCSTSQTEFLVSGSDSLAGPWNVSSMQLRRRAVVAVEAGADAEVAVEVHAPRVAAVRIGVAVRAVVGHVPPLGGEVVEAVVRPVRVVRRDQEDVGVLDDVLGRRVVRVVAHQPLGGLERDRHRHPLAGVVGRLDQHAGLASRHGACRSAARGPCTGRAGPRPRARRSRFWSRKSVSTTGVVVACTMPGAGVGAVRVRAVDQARARRPRSRPRPAPRCWRGAPVAFLASRTRTARPLTSTASGRSAPGRLTISTVIPLPPSCPHAAELTTTAACAAVPSSSR